MNMRNNLKNKAFVFQYISYCRTHTLYSFALLGFLCKDDDKQKEHLGILACFGNWTDVNNAIFEKNSLK